MSHEREVEIEGVKVALRYFSKGGERVRVWHTGVTADAWGPRSLSLEVREAGMLAPLARRLGMQDVATGSRGFDARFVVKSNMAEGARVWLHRRARGRIQRVSGYRFRLEEGRVSAARPGVEEDPAMEKRVLRAVASLARGTAGLEKTWVTVLDELDRGRVRRRINGWCRLKGELDGRAVSVRIRRRGDRLFTLVQAERAGKRRVDTRHAQLAELGATLAVERDAIVITIDGICDRPADLLTCIRAAVSTSDVHRGAYR
jgi:hypothetical protein